MLTKTFRAQNMLMALKNVQAELGPDAMIISMREVPAGPIWATWRKPGVEVIASESDNSKQKIKNNSDDAHVKADGQIKSPTQEELKREIDNLKFLVTNQKLPSSSNLQSSEPLLEKQKATSQSKSDEIQKFDFSDFKSIRDFNSEKIKPVVAKNENTPIKTASDKIETKAEENLPPKLFEIKQTLIDQGVNTELIDKIILTNLDALSPSILKDLPRLEKFISHQLSACLHPARKTIALVPSKVMLLAGISGCGKTSCCAKLASFYMLTLGKKVVWIEADTVRTSAIAEARTYTETLGIPLFLAYTPQELTELIESQSDADLILVDTAGCNPRNEDSVIELGSYLSSVPSGSIYLVASATTKEQDLIQVEKTLKQFGLKGVIITKTDETGSFGASFNLLWRSKLPVYFFSSGIQIFGNLKHGNPEQLAMAILDGKFSE